MSHLAYVAGTVLAARLRLVHSANPLILSVSLGGGSITQLKCHNKARFWLEKFYLLKCKKIS